MNTFHLAKRRVFSLLSAKKRKVGNQCWRRRAAVATEAVINNTGKRSRGQVIPAWVGSASQPCLIPAVSPTAKINSVLLATLENLSNPKALMMCFLPQQKADSADLRICSSAGSHVSVSHHHPLTAHQEAMLNQQLAPQRLFKESYKKQRKYMAFHSWNNTL